jgi:hypothetical protein
VHSRARSLVWVVSVFLGLGHFACGHALAQALRAARAQAGQIRVDGDLGEWRGVKAQTIGDDASGSIEARFAYVDDGLFVGVRVHDEAFVRSAKPSPKEDALVLGVALPDGTSVRASELWLFAGEQGSTRALMQRSDAGRSQLQAVPAAAQIVEGPAEGGYVVEAFVPWGALPGGEAHAFARASLRLHDVDRAGAAAHDVASTHETKPERWPLLELDGGAAGSIANFLRVKSLGGATPKLDWVGTLRANAGLERVLVIGTFVVRASGN